ncbi:putative gti1/Pac2 family protein [Lyophyllum shimeji]|uniref:Gti1/Pac2 family protein n=1 Tax=Lyophyllum shimeji TaxID=47721 RepID=A0A9P3PLT2_LYOSH|nr:putative gti1/Pac2 family protein [Lyophyllum shimeji]
MQQPTCTNIRIRSTQDAHRIFYAVQKGVLRMVARRLDAEERLALTTGCVYVWEERGPHSEITGLGIERFTEGRRWTPSRVRDEFLFYYEREPTPRPHDWDQLVKQTYSVWVDTEKGRRKWHLTAYFTDKTVNDLSTIDDIPAAKDLVVPPGLYQSTRVAKNRNRCEEQVHSSGKMSKHHQPRTYAPFSPYNHLPSHSASPPATESVTMYDPYKSSAASRHSPKSSGDPSPTSYSHIGPHSQGPSQPLPSPPHHLPPPAPYANTSHPPSLPGIADVSGIHNPHASSTSTMLPSILPTSPAWSRGSGTPSYPSQSIPRVMSKPYRYPEPCSLPPVSTVYDAAHFSSLGSTPEPSPRALVPAYDAPWAPAGQPREASYELATRESGSERRRGSLCSNPELALAPIHALERRHPYRRDPMDDEALRLLPH